MPKRETEYCQNCRKPLSPERAKRYTLCIVCRDGIINTIDKINEREEELILARIRSGR